MSDRPPPKSARAVQLAEVLITDWYADPDGEPYIDVTMQGVRRTLRVRSREVGDWLDGLFWDAEGAPLGDNPRRDAMNTVAARARHSGTERDVHVRVAGHDGDIWIDLADRTWRAIRVTAEGWSVVESGEVPVRFRRSRGMRPLPVPTAGGHIDDLKRFTRPKGDAYILLVSWILGALRPRGPYPILNLIGEAGSAKSTHARLVRSLVDPSEAPLRSPPRDDRDLVIAASNAHVVGIDNVSSLAIWLSDGLCRIATGGGFATRELYTNDEELILSAVRPIVMTGIEDVAAQGDLADRAYVVSLERIGDDERRTESELESGFAAAAPGILGNLLDAVSYGLAHEDEVQLDRLPRMADAARWIVACEPACPWPEGGYLAAYAEARAEMVSTGIAGDTVASALVTHLARCGGEWTGTADELLHELDGARNGDKPPRRWPETPRALSGRLTRAAPLLRGVGIEIERERASDRSRQRVIVLRTVADVKADGAFLPSEDRPNEKARNHAISDGSDDMDGTLRTPSPRTVTPSDHSSRPISERFSEKRESRGVGKQPSEPSTPSVRHRGRTCSGCGGGLQPSDPDGGACFTCQRLQGVLP